MEICGAHSLVCASFKKPAKYSADKLCCMVTRPVAVNYRSDMLLSLRYVDDLHTSCFVSKHLRACALCNESRASSFLRDAVVTCLASVCLHASEAKLTQLDIYTTLNWSQTITICLSLRGKKPIASCHPQDD
jgi:hypothetical protein